VRLLERRLGRPPRPHAVAPLDLVAVGELLAGEHSGSGPAARHLVAQPAVVEPVAERRRVGDELLRRHGLLGIRLLLQLGRAAVGVDEAVDVPPEPEPEQQVVLSRAHALAPGGGKAAASAPC